MSHARTITIAATTATAKNATSARFETAISAFTSRSKSCDTSRTYLRSGGDSPADGRSRLREVSLRRPV
jgi:hypothetical protein